MILYIYILYIIIAYYIIVKKRGYYYVAFKYGDFIFFNL